MRRMPRLLSMTSPWSPSCVLMRVPLLSAFGSIGWSGGRASSSRRWLAWSQRCVTGSSTSTLRVFLTLVQRMNRSLAYMLASASVSNRSALPAQLVPSVVTSGFQLMSGPQQLGVANPLRRDGGDVGVADRRVQALQHDAQHGRGALARGPLVDGVVDDEGEHHLLALIVAGEPAVLVNVLFLLLGHGPFARSNCMLLEVGWGVRETLPPDSRGSVAVGAAGGLTVEGRAGGAAGAGDHDGGRRPEHGGTGGEGEKLLHDVLQIGAGCAGTANML